jgi:hypothetical protein
MRIFQAQQAEFIKFRITRTALKNCIINAVDDKYINKIKNSNTGYATVTPNILLKHLWKHYGKVDDSDLSANELCMKAAWHPPTSIETLFEQLKDGQDFAKKGGENLTDATIIRYGYDIIKATGVFDRDCTKWRKMAAAEKTWEEFIQFFTIADDDRGKNSTTAEATYTANQVQELIQHELAAFITDQENIAPTAAAPQPASAPTHSAPAPLGTSQAVNSAVTLEDIKKLICEATSTATNTTNNKQRAPRAKRTQAKAEALLDGIPVCYCWTHGITRNLNHTSKTCTRPSEGHKTDATYANRLGGSDEVVHRRTRT